MSRLLSNSIAIPGFVCTVLALGNGALAAPVLTTLYSFKGGNDGAGPASVLVMDKKRNLYGTTNQISGTANLGTVYKVTSGGTETVLHMFTDGNDGAQPNEGLRIDSQGNLYGGTSAGGKSGLGTIYKLSRTGHLTVLYSFPRKKGADSANGDLIADNAGNMYGTAGGGTDGVGVIFSLSPARTFTVLHNFQNFQDGDGASPFSGLIADPDGTLYGTTLQGGAHQVGTLFSLSPGGTFTVLHSFNNTNGDGANPADAPVRDSSGTFLGVTETGGSLGFGTAYKVLPDGTETLLHDFQGGTGDGAYPAGRLVIDAQGNLLGVTPRGGTGDRGMIFRITPAGGFTVLYNFSGGADGSQPVAGLLPDGKGSYFGTTMAGGAQGLGSVFKFTP